MDFQKEYEKLKIKYENLQEKISIQKQTRISDLKAKIASLENENAELKITIQNMNARKHNERGAGRNHSLDDEQMKKVVELRNEGMTVKGIALKLNTSMSTVNRILRDYKTTGKLSYNSENERFGVLDSLDLWKDNGLHCGQTFDVLIDNQWVHDRIEMHSDKTWYLVESKLQGEQLEGLKVRIENEKKD